VAAHGALLSSGTGQGWDGGGAAGRSEPGYAYADEDALGARKSVGVNGRGRHEPESMPDRARTLNPVLSPRQQLLLRKVVDGFSATGQPVGSKALAGDPDVVAGPSTIRNELAVLEERGLLAHPHTSAGRVPTDAGYRYYVDELLPSVPAAPAALQLTLARREVDEAMRQTTETLSQVTNLLAIVSAPPIATTTIRHVEVLLLQPQVLMVVIITSTGGVSKRMFTLDRSVDPGLAEWAASYLNEQLVGMGLGARMLHSKLDDPSLHPNERAFIAGLAPAFTELAETAENTLYVDGAARLLSEHRFQDLTQLNELLEALERRVSLLGVLQAALEQRGIYVRIGTENQMPALRSLSLVAANYGLPQRNLGTVSVIGPTRMDYGHAIQTVREAALQLSRFVEDLYES
jgi:heat-inducible transcriptional repressor